MNLVPKASENDLIQQKMSTLLHYIVSQAKTVVKHLEE